MLRASALLLTLVISAACGGTGTDPSGGAGSGNAGGGGAPPGGAGGTGGTGGSAGSGGGGTGGGDPTPDPAFVPSPSGTCPTLELGTVTVSPDGNARDVEIWIGPEAATLDGPIVFFWHGAGGSPTEATYALSQTVIDEILAVGGIVAAVHHDPAAGQLPWFLSLGGTDESDLRVMDEVVACAIEQVGLDLRRIHSVGFSAGAMHNTELGWLRAGYVASIVNYSGAQLGNPTNQDPENLFPAMVVHGGPTDQVVVNFQTESESYAQLLTDAGHFAFLCNHGMGHTVPPDARGPAWQFLEDHPFGATPEPYAAGLPAGFPAYCAL